MLAFILFAVIFWIGAPTLGDPTSQVGYVGPNTPAQSIGLKAGDRLVSVNGVPPPPAPPAYSRSRRSSRASRASR